MCHYLKGKRQSSFLTFVGAFCQICRLWDDEFQESSSLMSTTEVGSVGVKKG